MTAEIRFDASDFDNLGRAIARLPGEIKTKAMARAMRRMRDMARTRIVDHSHKRTKVPVRMVQALTKAYFNAGGNTVEVIEKSGWIGLAKLGARQTKTGVTTRARGSYKSAFIATMASGHRAVLMRDGKGRLPIHELFGANPAHDVTNNPDEFLPVLAQLIEEHLAPRVLHEIERQLPR
ncbi:hypothetical protein [Sinorhizobium sp. BG8]|uniref:hypothetical protein n=1 Tax=Sinorhizobium sp. BG8 TaxID=2613773 RepID=UPI00193E1E92|nr:hypothetical protein [Sinorhizobium sp. BG8]QRM55135.1 hypothetical protein F3Y30_11775 [Sinorhizobium sp. BG8]